MFVVCEELPALSQDALQGLCVSLNSPVVHSDDLPLGPARAAIALHGRASELRLTLAVRSLDSATLALFEYDGELSQTDAPRQNIALAMSFGESLGFLFDEELIPSDESLAREALERWCELVGEGPVPDADVAATSPEGSSRASELLLDDELPEPRSRRRLADAGETQPILDDPPRKIATPLLSKFRKPLLDRAAVGGEPSDGRLDASQSADTPEVGAEAPPSDAPQRPRRRPAILNRLLACF